jgi:hypothetical protein
MPSLQLANIVPGVVSTYQAIAQEKGIQLGYIATFSAVRTFLIPETLDSTHFFP